MAGRLGRSSSPAGVRPWWRCLLSVLALLLLMAATTHAQLRYQKGIKRYWKRLSGRRAREFRGMAGRQRRPSTSAAGAAAGPPAVPWMPTDPSNPLPIHYIIDHPFPGYSGLNNILWSHGYALHAGCQAARGNQITAAGGSPSFAAVVLPDLMHTIREKQVFATLNHQHRFSELFDMDTLARLAIAELQCFVTDLPTLATLAGQGLVALAPPESLVVSQAEGRETSWRLLDTLYRGLAPSKHLHSTWIAPCLEKISRRAGGGPSGFLAVHARVEDDWLANGDCAEKERKYNRHRRRRPHRIRLCFTAAEIADTVQRTVNASEAGHNVLVIYAEDLMDTVNKTAIQETRLKTQHPMSVWPSGWRISSPFHLKCLDQSQAPHDELTYTKKAAVSFFLAAESTVFVGGMRSSMSKGIARYRFGQHRLTGNKLDSYAYDCTGTGYEPGSRVFFGPMNVCPAGSCCLGF